ncbi:hypothetical protein D1872_50540 [compost metagenome]
MEGMSMQPHLGRFHNNYHPSDNMGGYLALAKVLEVHHKNGTADVMIVKTNNSLTSASDNEGRFAARIGTVNAHYDKDQFATSGVVEPIQEGQLVVLAFLDGLKSQPIILTSFHNNLDTRNNILTNVYPLEPLKSIEDFNEALKYLRVFPSQLYHKVDGSAGIEISHPSKSFLKVEAADIIDDSHEGFDHDDLSEKDPNTFRTRSGRTEESSLPINLLFVHRSSFEEDFTTWTKFFLANEGLFRITRDNNDDKLLYQEFSEEGAYCIRRQLDTPKHGEGQDYVETRIDTDGTYNIIRKKQGKETKITLNGDVLSIVRGDGQTTSITLDDNAVISTNGDIKLQADTKIEGDLNVTGNLTVTGNASVGGTITMGGKTVATVDQLHDH